MSSNALVERHHPAPDSASGGAESTAELARQVLAQLRGELQPVPRLLDQPAAWRYLGLSRSMWFRLRAAGELPDPVRVPGRKLPMWRVEDLDRWPRRLKPAR